MIIRFLTPSLCREGRGGSCEGPLLKSAAKVLLFFEIRKFFSKKNDKNAYLLDFVKGEEGCLLSKVVKRFIQKGKQK